MSDALRNDTPFERGPTVVESHPQVFARAIVTPPGAPWEQARAAKLDAQHGAPLPLSELLHRVKRLSGWGPGRPGRFAVFYVRTKEFRAPFEAKVDVEGQIVTVSFGLGGDQARRVQGWGMIVLLLILVGAVLGAGVTLALGARTQATARLEATEKLGAAKLASAHVYRQQIAQARGLHAALGAGRSIGEMMEDLTWVATSKGPDTRVAAVHWQGGVMAVEVRGEAAPFAAPDRRLERAPHPLRPGVWLWGVGSKTEPPTSSMRSGAR